MNIANWSWMIAGIGCLLITLMFALFYYSEKKYTNTKDEVKEE